jgi:hypothetical protein
VSGTDSTAQPSEERQTNRTRRPQVRKTPRAAFPLITEKGAEVEARRAAVLRGADLDVSDPSAGGGRGFKYQWEDTAADLEQQIQSVAAGGGIAYVHHQTVPAATWVIDHHMSLIPNVVLLDGTGEQMIAEIRHPSDQTTVVVHSAPYTGTAYLRP